MSATCLKNFDPSAPTDLAHIKSDNSLDIESDIDQQDRMQIIQVIDSDSSAACNLANVKAEKPPEIRREIEQHKQIQVETQSNTRDEVLDNEADNTMVCTVIDSCTVVVLTTDRFRGSDTFKV